MRKLYFTLFYILAGVSISLAQVVNPASFNLADISTSIPDSLRPWSNDKGIRSVCVTNDLDNDGKIEFLVTDYTNGGRVHVLELTNANTIELVWSSPTRAGISSGSTPRWVQFGDLDGDGNKEIIFPLTTGTADFEVEVYEYQGNDNDYGTSPAFTLPMNYFAAQGVGNFRTNREVASVYDFDGDGLDELIMSNRDHNVYVLGVFGQFPGFASWQLEGGDPAVVPVNSGKYSMSHWHSVAADIDGDGKKEIVNHMWNFYGFWSIDPTGPDSYAYPDTAIANHYVEFMKGTYGDMVCYMGIQPVDVNGDGRQEIAGIMYGGDSAIYSVALISMSAADTGLYIWDVSKAGVIGKNLWEAAGYTAGSFWGIGAADINGNGKEDILLGGGGGFNIMALEYNGTGSLLDPTSYTARLAYEGPVPYDYGFYNIYDSLGTMDTVKTETPFISKMNAGFDSNNDGKKEIAASYQSVYDSLTYKYYHYNTDSVKFILDTTFKVRNTKQFSMRLLESTTTGLEARELNLVTPEDYVLAQNYPNPFNPSTQIRFALPIDKKISLKVYDILGNLVSTVIDNQDYHKGSYEIVWNGTNSFGTKVASGNYIAELRYGNFAKTIKMTLLK